MRPRSSAACALAIAVVLTGCSSNTSGSGGTGSTTSTSSSSASSALSSPSEQTSSSSSSSRRPTGTGSPLSDAQVERALLTAAEVGPGYRAEPEEDDGGSAAPCEPPGTPSISERVPHQADAGRQFDHSTIEVSYTESIMIYASDDEATQAYEIFANGMDCSQGKIDDLTIAIEDPVDVSQSVLSGRTGKAQAWTLNAGTTLDGVIVVIRSGRVILLLAGLKAPSVDQKTVPDPVALAKEGFEKALRN